MMSKTIKVDDQVYERLDGLIVHRETFSHVIQRLLKVYDIVSKIDDTLGPSHYLREHPLGGKTIEETSDR